MTFTSCVPREGEASPRQLCSLARKFPLAQVQDTFVFGFAFRLVSPCYTLHILCYSLVNHNRLRPAK